MENRKMQAIKSMATVDSQGQLALDDALSIDRNSRVEVIILVPDSQIIDEDDEPKEKILIGLRESLQDLKEGRVYPIAELWDGIDV
jgi:hypothetical protein